MTEKEQITLRLPADVQQIDESEKSLRAVSSMKYSFIRIFLISCVSFDK